jgi:outer membrane lipopolysaccharide assembly protein LptE/RlpB
MTLRRTIPIVLTLLATMLASTLVAACGYTTRSLVSEDFQTIAVPVFDNTTRRHDLEWEVTRAVVEELQARTHLVVVPEDAGPDLVLSGTLVDVDEDTLSRRKRQRPRDSVVHVTAEIQVRNAKSGDDLVPRRRVSERESYTYLAGEDVRTAREEAVRSLAERVVRQLEEGW